MNQLENKNDLVLDIENLSVRFATEDGVVNAVNGLDPHHPLLYAGRDPAGLPPHRPRQGRQ